MYRCLKNSNLWMIGRKLMNEEKYPSLEPDDYETREDYLEAVCEWWALEGKRWGERIRQLEAELEEWKGFRAAQIDQEAKNAIGYSKVCQERDEARNALERLQGETGQMMGVRTTTARVFKWVTQQRDEAQMIARLLYKWAYWLDREMNNAYCACSVEELEELRMGDMDMYEEWRRVRESGLGNKYPWLKGKQ
jgi:hypothetical protein